MRQAAIAVALCALLPSISLAHVLSCRQTFNGARILVVDTYPATIEVRVVVINEHPDAASDALDVRGELLPPDLFEVPFTVPVGESETRTFSFTVHSFEECRQLPVTRTVGGVYLMSVVEVEWDIGAAQCSAAIVCRPAVCE